MKSQATVTTTLIVVISIVLALMLFFFIYDFYHQTFVNPTPALNIANFQIFGFKQNSASAGYCSFSFSFTTTQPINNFNNEKLGFVTSQGFTIFPNYNNLTETSSIVTNGEYLYQFIANNNFINYNTTICNYISNGMTKTEYITGIKRSINNKIIYQPFTSSMLFTVDTPNTNPAQLFDKNIISVASTYNFGYILVSSLTNSSFKPIYAPSGEFLYLQNGKYQIEYISGSAPVIFLQWQGIGGVSITDNLEQITNMTVINNGEIKIDNYETTAPTSHFVISANRTEALLNQTINVSSNIDMPGYYTFSINNVPINNCVDITNDYCKITESAPNTYNVSVTFKNTTSYKIAIPISIKFLLYKNYVPITFTNTQSDATPSPFQQMFIFNPSNYSNFINNNLGNVRFFYGSTPIHSWCEYGCSNTSTYSIIWLNIPQGINSKSAITINMSFLNMKTNYDGNIAGEAPVLPNTFGQHESSYAAHDNGAKVFEYYENFAGSHSFPYDNYYANHTQYAHIDNGLYINASGGGTNGNYIYTSTTFPTGVFGYYFNSGAAAGGVRNYQGVYYSSSEFPTTPAIGTAWYYAAFGYDYVANIQMFMDNDSINGNMNSATQYGVSTSWLGNQFYSTFSINPSGYLTNAFFLGPYYNYPHPANATNPDVGIFNIKPTPSNNPPYGWATPENITSYYVYLNKTYDGTPITTGHLIIYPHTGSTSVWYYIFEAAYPPNGVMPSIKIGNVQ